MHAGEPALERTDNPLPAMLGDLIRSTFDRARGRGPGHSEAVRLALLQLVAANATPEPAAADSPLIRQVKAYLLRYLDDPYLSPGIVAKAHRISTRHLHRLFGATGSSLSAWIRQQRLARCAAELRDPAQRDATLTQIAFRWGFNESAQFSRSFRAAFGQTPSDYRARHRA